MHIGYPKSVRFRPKADAFRNAVRGAKRGLGADTRAHVSALL